MQKSSNSQIRNAVIATVIACSAVFTIALYIFGTGGLGGQRPMVTPDISTGSGIMISIPLPIQTGSLALLSDTGTVVTDTGTRMCTMEYAPVCGSDGQTYANACTAGEVSIDHIGACDMSDLSVDLEGSGTLTPTDYSDTGSYLVYSNSRLGYSFSMPRYVHYAGAGARDGASHTVAIATSASGVTDFAIAPVQVWFYSSIPLNPPSSQSATLTNGTLYIRNNDTTGNVKISKIVETVMASAR